MSKIYEALEQEERRRRELDRPTIKRAPEALSSVPEPVQPPPQHHHETQLWTREKSAEPEHEMVDLYYTLSSLTLHKPGQVIQFVSSIPGEGASTLAEEFGRVSAEDLGKNVLLLKAAGNGSGSNHDGTEETSPMFERLLHNGTRVDEIFHKDGEARFFVCPVKHESSISSLLSSPKVDRVFDKLREYFDLILVDTPSVATSPTGLAMCRKADGVVLVVEAESTRLPAVQVAKQKIQKAGGNILGVILNKYKSHIPGLIETHL